MLQHFLSDQLNLLHEWKATVSLLDAKPFRMGSALVKKMSWGPVTPHSVTCPPANYKFCVLRCSMPIVQKRKGWMNNGRWPCTAASLVCKKAFVISTRNLDRKSQKEKRIHAGNTFRVQDRSSHREDTPRQPHPTPEMTPETQWLQFSSVRPSVHLFQWCDGTPPSGGSRILVRGSGVLNPRGAWAQNLLTIRGFPIKLPENCMILKKSSG